MIGTWFRSALLLVCRIAGGARRLLRRRLLFHALVLVAIAVALRGVDLLAARMRAPSARATPADTLAQLPAAPPDSAPAPATPAAVQDTAVRPARTDSVQAAVAAPASRDSGAAAAVPPAREPRRWLTVWNTLSIWAFGLVAWFVFQARSRLVIATFEDFSNDKVGMAVAGFHVLVAAELGGLGDLFGEFDAGGTLETTTGEQPHLRATFQTESASEFLGRAVSSETSFALAGFKVPVGFVLGLVGRLVQGPVLSAQVHRDGDCRVVTARLGGDRTFRLADLALSGTGEQAVWRPARELARELACRIFSEVAMGGAVTWRALDGFAHGVRAYRDSLRAPQTERALWREAERRLRQAVAEDPRFDLAYYDLGVVFNRRGHLDSADIAFLSAIEAHERAGRWSAHYALAYNTYLRAGAAYEDTPPRPVAGAAHLSRALNYCNQAGSLAPDAAARARVLSLKTAVLWWRAKRAAAALPAAQWLEVGQAVRLARRTVWQGWWALCGAELGLGTAPGLGAERDRARALASQYLQDLASMARELAALWPQQRGMLLRVCARHLREARRLTPESPQVHRALGEVHLERGRFAAARRSLWSAVRLEPAAAPAWAQLALACARRGLFSEAHEAARGFCENLHGASPESVVPVVRAMATHAAAIERWRRLRHEIAQRAQRNRGLGLRLWAMRRFFRDVYEMAEHDLTALGLGTAQRRALLEDPTVLDPTFDEVGRSRRRAVGFPAFRERFRRSRARGGDQGIADLEKLFDERREAGHDWEVAEVGYALFRAYHDAGTLAKAEDALRRTLAHLEGTLPSEIRRRGLYAQLSRVLRRQDKDVEALARAQTAVVRDPLSWYERMELGHVHFGLGEYSAAQEAWHDAVRLDPDDPKKRVNLARAYLAEIDDLTDRAGRAAQIGQAVMQLRAALDLFEPDDEERHLEPDDEQRHRAQFLLAMAHGWAGRYDEAVRELRALDRRNYCNLAVSLALADAQLASDDWAEAEQRFRGALADAERALVSASEGVNQVVHSPLHDIVLGVALAWARLGVAATLGEREIFLDEAISLIEAAKQDLDGVSDPDLRREWLGSSAIQEGAILLKANRVDEAIAALEKALRIDERAETYLLLGNALVRKGEETDASKRAPLLRRGERYYDEAQRRDSTGMLDGKIAAARRELAALVAGGGAPAAPTPPQQGARA